MGKHTYKPFTIVVLVLCCGLAGCGGTRILKEPKEIALVEPLATAADPRVDVALDLVIVRDGPGTRAKNADWDEYLLRVVNRSDRARLYVTVGSSSRAWR